MAMEERQTRIKEGAGLEESRLNTEFIDMMRKWGPHFVMGLAIIAGGYAAYNWYERKSAEKVDGAYVALNAAAQSANPTNLERVAAEEGAGTAVPIEARSYAADLHMQAARTGVPIGEKLDGDKLPEGKSFLTDEEKKKELTKAEELYNVVLASTNSSEGQTIFAIGALTGLASIAEDRGELDKARGFYTQAAEKAASTKIQKLSDMIKHRIETLDTLKSAPKLLTAADLPAGPEKPIVQPLGGFTATTSTGQVINLPQPKPGESPGTVQIPGGGSLTPVSPPNTTPTPAPTPAPAPAPAPTKPAGTP